jgi:protein kinase-like protein/tetratricopeptide repeat protein
VKGIPFTRYCDDARLSIAGRLALFVPVCQAIQHAHQKGIIHRDLKPSNILICLYDGKPVPKVIDFGLAKAIHQPLTEHTLHTAHGIMMGTPLYMSPEQAEFNNLDVDTRTDIYALGVILYELLTGTTPLEKQRFQEAAWHDRLRLIKEEEPPRPSARLSGSGSLPSLAAQRQLEPTKLPRMVRGELDWIVMKCLEKDRSRRYDTATGLARDVERYLADDPVEACPPSAAYHLWKFARKNRATLAIAAAILLLLVAGVVVGICTRLAVRATHAEGRALNEQEKTLKALTIAEQNRNEANVTITFLKDLTMEMRHNVKEGNEWQAMPFDELPSILDSEKIRRVFADHPLAEAEIREWLAGNMFSKRHGNSLIFKRNDEGTPLKGPVTFEGPDHAAATMLLDPDRARKHLERALDLREIHLGPNDPKTLATIHLLSQTVDTIAAIKLLTELVGRSQNTLGKDHDSTLIYQADLASAYEFAKRPVEAEALRRNCLTVRERKYPDDWMTFKTSFLLGADLLSQTKYAEAEPLLLAGYKGMKRRENQMPNEDGFLLFNAAESLTKLYDAWNKKDIADEWRKRLDEARNAGKRTVKP